MKTEVKNFSQYFVKQLGGFVGKMKKSGERAGLTKEEVNAVASEAFHLLGNHHEALKKKANIN